MFATQLILFPHIQTSPDGESPTKQAAAVGQYQRWKFALGHSVWAAFDYKNNNTNNNGNNNTKNNNTDNRNSNNNTMNNKNNNNSKKLYSDWAAFDVLALISVWNCKLRFGFVLLISNDDFEIHLRNIATF